MTDLLPNRFQSVSNIHNTQGTEPEFEAVTPPDRNPISSKPFKFICSPPKFQVTLLYTLLIYPNLQFQIIPSSSTTKMSESNNQNKPPSAPASLGISALQINQAREMVSLHTRNRNPNLLTTSSDLHARIALQKTPAAGLRSTEGAVQNLAQKGVFSAPKSHFSAQLNFPSKVSVPARNHSGECRNPQCDGCGTVIIPLPKASFPFEEKPSITVNEWSIYTHKGPICLSDELDHLNDTRYDFPLPEMIFGGNKVRLVHDPSGAVVEFNTLDALDSLAPKADFKVAYYKEWLSTRPKAMDDAELTSLDDVADQRLGPDLELVKPYDWTYSTNYRGTLVQSNARATDEDIPMDRLLRQDPILFYDESVLFEDELGDNGIAILSTKIRVMHTCLLLLCRFFMRVDDVAFRIRDTRVFIDLETNKVLREYKVQQSLFEDVLKKISGRTSDPKKLFRDSNWVAQNIPVLSREVEIIELEQK